MKEGQQLATVVGNEAPLRLSARFTEAFDWAMELHGAQVRKGTPVPYISHLMAVAALVLEHGGDEEETIAALLHDAVEDAGGDKTRQEIIRRFGQRVGAIVDGCTDTDMVPKPPWKERKERYIAHLATATSSVLLVSASDKLHNARAVLLDFRLIGNELWCRFRGGREGTLWYYRALVDAFREIAVSPGCEGDGEPRIPTALVDELERTVVELERLTSKGA